MLSHGANVSPAYVDYEKWKRWDEAAFFQVNPVEAAYLPRDFEHLDLRGKSLLEIGFGNGALLAWAEGEGAEVYGAEVLDEAIARAQARNIPLLSANMLENLPAFTEFFDVIAAFDVCEHLTIDELKDCLSGVDAMLKPGGRGVFRFPNGQSPFSMLIQNADATHVSVLSLPIFERLVARTSLRIVKVTCGAEVAVGSLFKRVAKRAKFALRRASEWYLTKIFDLNCPLGANLVITVQKSAIDEQQLRIAG